MKGCVVSSKDQTPIKGVGIYVTKGSTNDFGTVITTENGAFL